MTTPTPSCSECRVRHLNLAGVGHRIVFCPLHEAAADMRDALAEALAMLEREAWEASSLSDDSDLPADVVHVLARARAALDKARSTTPTT